MSQNIKQSDKLLAKFLKSDDIDNKMRQHIIDRFYHSMEYVCPSCSESKRLSSFLQLTEGVITKNCYDCLLKEGINLEEYIEEVLRE